ncbi:MAG: hypothetical protein IAG13_04310, partial [Deltaproteobacteria bacterium]|nr:hypothetical protein [Nannocystaceae bacterium]
RTSARDCGSELGSLLDTGCLQRSRDFDTPAPRAGAPAIDVGAEGCAAECSLPSFGVLPPPSLFDDDDEPSAGPPWLAEVRGQPSGLSRAPLADALACLVPVGVGGCEQESPLGAMLAAIDRSLDADDPAYGWMRDDAGLFAVLITDEDEADSELPLIAAARLRELLAFKQAMDPELSVVLGLVAGWDDTYEPTPSGCTSYEQSAAPPLRLDVLRRAARDVFVETASICEQDFTTVLNPLARRLPGEIRPLCIDHCVEIGEDEAPRCTAELREWAGDESTAATLPLCLHVEPHDWRMPDGADRCVIFQHDSIQEICFERGSNVEVQMIVRDEAPILGASCIEVTCEVADDPRTECPDMP